MGDAEEADAQAAVEAPPPLSPQELRGTCPHARICANRATIGRQHPRLQDPDGIGDDLGAHARDAGGDEIILGREGGRMVAAVGRR